MRWRGVVLSKLVESVEFFCSGVVTRFIQPEAIGHKVGLSQNIFVFRIDFGDTGRNFDNSSTTP
jgi:hypothetical protein